MFRMDNASWAALLPYDVPISKMTTRNTTMTRERNTTTQDSTQRRHNLSSQTHGQQQQQHQDPEKQPTAAIPSPTNAKARLHVKIWDMLRAKFSRPESKTDRSPKLNCFRGNCFSLHRRRRRNMGRNSNIDDPEGEQSRLLRSGAASIDLSFDLGLERPDVKTPNNNNNNNSNNSNSNNSTGMRTRCTVRHIPLKRSGAIRGRKTAAIKTTTTTTTTSTTTATTTTLKRSGAIRGRKPRVVGKTSLTHSGAIRSRRSRDMIQCILASTTADDGTSTIMRTTRSEIDVMDGRSSSQDVSMTRDSTNAAIRPGDAEDARQARDACVYGPPQYGQLSAQYRSGGGGHDERKDDVAGLKPAAWMRWA